ncbi:MAG: ATP-binding protein [Phaeodactylibacter sp.]|nr:ATP-binding protein [Phaeodactylibacter sp.]
MDTHLQLQVRNELTELPRVQRRLHDFFEQQQLSAAVRYALELSVEELLTNLIHHGYRGEGRAAIRLQIERQDQQVELILKDDAPAFNPLEIPPPNLSSPLSERPVGGLGLHLIRELMDEIDYQYDEHYNCITLRKYLT